MLGDPQLKDGPFQEITVDSSIQIKDYYNALGWNPDTGVLRQMFLKDWVYLLQHILRTFRKVSYAVRYN